MSMVINPYLFGTLGVWSEIAGFVPTSVSDGWGGYTLRQSMSGITALPPGAAKLRFTLRCPAGKGLSLGKAYVGNRSGDYGYSEPPVQVYFTGSPGVSVSGGVDVVSDPVDIVVGSSGLVFSSFFNGTSSVPVSNYEATGGWSGNAFSKIGDDAITTSASGYDLFPGRVLIVKIEKRT